MITVRAGALLIALPMLTDPNFAHTVVFVVEHGPEGTVGLVLNRPSHAELLDRLPGWWSAASDPRTFHVGGPCEVDAALCLGVGAPGPDTPGLRHVSGGPADAVYLVDLDADPDVAGARLRGLRVFAGYAGWSAGQLDGELAAQAWEVVPGFPGDVIAERSAGLWREVLRRQGGPLGMLAAWTADPRLN